MAGLSAAWRLSESGWRDRLEAITVYQRGHRLGGKAASSRGANGRIEEHGLHIWLGYYENAFRLLRECYDQLDRNTTDPASPIQTWRQAMIPAPAVGLEEWHAGSWHHWLGQFAENDQLPGEPDAAGGEMTVVEFVARSIRLLRDFGESLRVPATGGRVSLSALPTPPKAEGAGLGGSSSGAGLRRARHLIEVVLATLRGIVADGLLVHPDGFRAINDEDYAAWIERHGASKEAVASTLVRGLYDLVFAHEDGDPGRAGFCAGWGAFLSMKTFFDYKGSIFWKMTAGMGDVVMAPLYQALRARGVDFEFFHRVDDLELSPDTNAIEAIRMGVQARLAAGHERYEPLVRVKGLACFPEAPLVEQLATAAGIEHARLESVWSDWPDAEQVVLRRGHEFDIAVLAIPVGMAPVVCGQLVAARREWRDMVANLRTVATQAFQVWLSESEPELGWHRPGSTMSGYVKPFDTWASMPQVLPAEDWPAGDRPRSVSYFCTTLRSDPVDLGDAGYADRHREQVKANAVRFLEQHAGHLLPGAVGPAGFRWELLCGRSDLEGQESFDSQFWTANVDPSDRYVQSMPGTDKWRLRADESGFDNLVLAGDWIDCGLNAGCIEAAVLSGLQAANVVVGRPRMSRIAGYYLP